MSGFKTKKRTLVAESVVRANNFLKYWFLHIAQKNTNLNSKSIDKHLLKLPVWWHVVNGLLGLELLGFLIPTVNCQK